MSASDGAGLEVIMVRMEGKLDRMNDRMERYERDHNGLRSRVHELANHVAEVKALNVPAHIERSNVQQAENDARITALENVEQQRKGAATVIKILWAIGGAVGVGGAAAVLRLFHVGGV